MTFGIAKAFLLLPNLACIYRFPLVVYRLAIVGTGSGDYRTPNTVLVDNLYEHVVDVAALLAFLFVCLNPNQMIPMCRQLRVDLRDRKSITQARKTIFAYLPLFWSDMVWVASAPTRKLSCVLSTMLSDKPRIQFRSRALLGGTLLHHHHSGRNWTRQRAHH